MKYLQFGADSELCARFDSIVHSTIPSDAVKVSDSVFKQTLQETEGVWAIDSGGVISCIPRVPTLPSLIEQERTWRDAELSAVQWLRERHRDQLEIDMPTTITVEQFVQLLVYMQALRDWPQSPDFPDIQHRPIAPPWIAEQTQ